MVVFVVISAIYVDLNKLETMLYDSSKKIIRTAIENNTNDQKYEPPY